MKSVDDLALVLLLFVLAFFCSLPSTQATSPSGVGQAESPDGWFTLDGTKLGRRFEGIGGLSGGGATSRLLPDYPEPQRSHILDYLFTPNFGASLHILKVEIGGDGQTTDGTEPSHMHSKNDENYRRGYEWWLMTEAKKRNPNIKLYGLSWSVPGWIGGGNYFSQDNIDYHIKWLQGAKRYYNLDIDYLGIWNERSFTNDKNCTFIKNLRAALDKNGFHNVQLVAADGDWRIVDYLKVDSKLFDDVAIVGVHYPGTVSPVNAIALNKPLWASEDYSTFADYVGGGCWARILNQNYVNGFMTSTIAWNLIAAYYQELPFGGDGLMWATEPWGGHYDIKSPIWISAHTTQFTEPGYFYLGHGYGTGKFPLGGSYVTLVPPQHNGHFTLVIEMMSHNHSICIRPDLPPYSIAPQTVTFKLAGGLNPLKKPLNLWRTRLNSKEADNDWFEYVGQIHVDSSSMFTLPLEVDAVYTVTTSTAGRKGRHPPPPSPSPFPFPYFDDFEKYPVDYEARYFADQTGSWSIYANKQKGKTLRQEVPAPLPSGTEWCSAATLPVSIIGRYDMKNYSVSSEVLIESEGMVILGGRTQVGGCANTFTSGYYLFIDSMGSWYVTAGTRHITDGTAKFSANTWHHMKISFQGTTISGYLDTQKLFSFSDSQFSSGWAAIGSSYNFVQFDNFVLGH